MPVNLPLELLLQIADYVPTASLSALSRASHALYDVLTPLLDIHFAAEARTIFMWALRQKAYTILSRALDLGTPSPSLLPYNRKYLYVHLTAHTGDLSGEFGRVPVKGHGIIKVLMDAWSDGRGGVNLLPVNSQRGSKVISWFF